MTKEEMIDFAKEQCEIFSEDSAMGEYLRDTLKMLRTEPCEDAVSRKDVINYIRTLSCDLSYWSVTDEVVKDIEALQPVTPTHTETVTEFADRCMECGNEYGKQLKYLERIKARYDEERGILLNSNLEYTPNNVLDIIDYIIHGD